MSFKNNLKSQRLKSHFSQEVLAEKVSVSRQTISKWENGDTYPSTEHIFMLAEILDCSVNDLIHNPPSNFAISTTKAPEEPAPIQLRFNQPRFLIAGLLAALILVASTFTFCFKTPNYSKINTQKLAIFDQVLNDSLDNLIDDPIFNNSTNKKIVGYGITEPDGTFYIKCALSSDSASPCSAIIYFCKTNNDYSYKCEYLDDPDYLPRGEYYKLS